MLLISHNFSFVLEKFHGFHFFHLNAHLFTEIYSYIALIWNCRIACLVLWLAARNTLIMVTDPHPGLSGLNALVLYWKGT